MGVKNDDSVNKHVKIALVMLLQIKSDNYFNTTNYVKLKHRTPCRDPHLLTSPPYHVTKSYDSAMDVRNTS